MNVCLIDVDGKIPNLALMRASTVHKQNGDNVKLGYDPLFDNPDLCYASKIFDFTQEPEYMPECKTLKGGTGYDLNARMPFDDYDRYQRDFARWCNNKAVWRNVKWQDYDCPTNRATP